MSLKNRVITIIFFVILSPIIAIIGLLISSIIDPESTLLPEDIKRGLNWFSQNIELSKNIISGLYILAAVFVLIALYNIVATAFDRGSDEDLR